MFFFVSDVVKQVNNSSELHLRYVDDIFLAVNWPKRHWLEKVDKWNEIDWSIQLKAEMGVPISFLDLHFYIENNYDQ